LCLLSFAPKIAPNMRFLQKSVGLWASWTNRHVIHVSVAQGLILIEIGVKILLE